MMSQWTRLMMPWILFFAAVTTLSGFALTPGVDSAAWDWDPQGETWDEKAAFYGVPAPNRGAPEAVTETKYDHARFWGIQDYGTQSGGE